MSLIKVMTIVASVVLIVFLALIATQVIEWQFYKAEPSLWPPVQLP